MNPTTGSASDRLATLFSIPTYGWILIDADDTVWHDACYFRVLREGLVRAAACCGVDRSRITELLSDRVRYHSPGEHGYAAAVREAWSMLAGEDNLDKALDKDIAVFLDHPIEVLPFAREAIEALGDRQKVLFTKGMLMEQQRKLQLSDLGSHFSSVMVVRQKDANGFAQVCRELGVDSREVIVIGNSIRHDIVPAAANGAATIWLNHTDNFHGRNGDLPAQAYEVTGWDIIWTALARCRRNP